MVKVSNAFSIIIFIAAISFASPSFGAEALSKDLCQSSVIIDGMKVELSLTAPIIVEKNTNKLVESEFNNEEKRQVLPSIRLSFTAIDKDIQWQEYLYSFGIFFKYMDRENWKYFLPLYSLPYVDESLLKISILKKDAEKIKIYPLNDDDFQKIFFKNEFDLIFGAEGKLIDLSDLAPNPEVTNIYEGDKNIWQAPFEICLKTKWQYN
ncbi:hypothetical protein N5853_14000 (plasmid) [Bartonella sp. HY329]|uniref:hypothetical protein n=1 Tax=unclassified Bartonella TaxID=2645622 RepID=UPI0021C7B67E|nr:MULTISPECIES: hypothetical protein [unclassified Bartonella]UXM96642.1 hypothetical protein N5853_14000 [Bartonella sp. HY329]UXN10965.1 hypothetical protein N5852_14005 [Bartonella sp. HY328]